MNFKSPIQLVFGNAVAIVITSAFVSGFKVDYTIYTISTAAVILSLANVFVEPILNAVSFPINMVTLGLFHLLINTGLLYLTMQFVEGMEVGSGKIHIDFMGLVIPEVQLSSIWMLVVVAIVIRTINVLLKLLVF